MSLLDHQEQLDWYDRMRLENEAQVEQEIRKIALNYCERSDQSFAGSLYGGGQRVTFMWPGSAVPAATASFQSASSPNPFMLDYRTIDLRIDVHPMVEGFERLLIAEEQLREQIAQVTP